MMTLPLSEAIRRLELSKYRDKSLMDRVEPITLDCGLNLYLLIERKGENVSFKYYSDSLKLSMVVEEILEKIDNKTEKEVKDILLKKIKEEEGSNEEVLRVLLEKLSSSSSEG